jgi:DNA-binding MarR family transcriptional regulator
MTPTTTLTTRDIGLAENALRAVLEQTLAGTGLDYHRWVALKATSDSPTPPSPGELAALMTGGLKIDAATAAAVIDALGEQGIFETDGNAVAVTPAGAALYRRLSEEIGQLSRKMYTGLDPDDLTVAGRVLATLTERANARLAG